MKSKLDVTLTDFIYAIVVGAAFQRIDAPVFSISNLYLLIAFVVIIDDWVLYHLQASKVPDSKLAFSKSLVIDSFVLLTWYCAAVSGSHAHDPSYPYVRDFYIGLGVFYIFTITWEISFKDITGNSGRVLPDALALTVVFSAFLMRDTSNFLIIAPVLFILWLFARSIAWRRLVFNDKFCASKIN